MRARGESCLGFGKNSDGSAFSMSKTAFEGQKKYHALRKAQRGYQHKAGGGAKAAAAVAPRQVDRGEKSVALGAHSSVVLGTHCSRHCDTCLTAQECLRDEVFSARASMFIFPSSQVLGIRTERARATAAEVPGRSGTRRRPWLVRRRHHHVQRRGLQQLSSTRVHRDVTSSPLV